MSKTPHAFITGVTGFAGSWLAEELIRAGYRVSGSVYKKESRRNLAAVKDQIRFVPLDIMNASECRTTVRRLEPDYIFHLAAIASVGNSFDQETVTFQVNFQGTLNMLEAARHDDKLKKFIFTSSADCYGRFKPKNKTLTEEQPLNPISPYGIAKTAAEHAVRYYHRLHGLPTVVARSFNHSGPRQTDSFVVPAFARQVARIEAGKQKAKLEVGDLSAKRDFSDVRDIVLGYRLIAEKGKPGETYQLCSGKATSIQSILNRLTKASDKKITVHVDQSRLRKADIPVLRGSNDKAARELGFVIRYTLNETVRDTLNYWRQRERASANKQH